MGGSLVGEVRSVPVELCFPSNMSSSPAKTGYVTAEPVVAVDAVNG